MAQESKLVISVDATKAKTQIDNLNKQMLSIQSNGDKASKSVDIFGEKIKKVGNESPKTYESIKKLAGVMGTLAGATTGIVAALAGASIAYAKNAKELDNFARLADANVVEFQRMAVAANRYGVSSEQLSDQLKDFNEKLGEFVLTGSGEAKDAFELLSKRAKMSGEEIKKFAIEMQKASGPEALQMYVSRLEKAGVSQEQLSFLVENMGNDLTKLLPILKNGGKELKEMADEAQRLGVIMDEKAVKQALELEKQINKLQMQVKGATNQFMTGFIPSLLKVGDAAGDATTNSELLTQAGQDMGEVFKGVTAVAMGAYVAISSVARSIIGVAKDASDAASSMSKIDGIKSWFGVGGTKNILATGILAFNGKNTQTATAKNSKTAEDYATFMNKLYEDAKNVTEKTNEELAKIGTGNGITAGIEEFNEKMAKEAKDAADKAKAEAEKLAQAQLRIQYTYADKETQIQLKLAEDIKEIRESKINNQELYIEAAHKRAYLEKQIYLSVLQFETNEFQLSEKQKLKYQYDINQLMIHANNEMTEENKKIRLQALEDEYKLNKQKIILQMQEREFQAKQAFMRETDAMNERYRLEEANILLINDEKERAHLLELKRYEKDIEIQDRLAKAAAEVDRIRSEQKGTSALNDIYAKQAEANNASAELLEAQIAAGYENQEQLQIEHLARMTENEKAANQARIKLQTAWGMNYISGAADVLKQVLGENSKAYQAMFAMQKAMAIAQVLMNAPTTFSNVYNSASAIPVIGPFIAPVMAGGALALQMAQAATVGNVSFNPAGFKTGGYTGNSGTSDVAGVVHGQEYVLNAAATKRVGKDTLDAINSGGSLGSGGVSVTIQNYGTSKAFEVQQLDANTVRIIARDEARNTVASDFQNPNSQISKAASQNLNAPRRRG